MIETHGPEFQDLRLDEPFPELVAHAKTYNIDTDDAREHAHVPWIVLALQLMQRWADEHDGAKPSRADFKAYAKAHSVHGHEENHAELATNLFRCFMKTTIPSRVK